jgi:hypothetical protein
LLWKAPEVEMARKKKDTEQFGDVLGLGGAASSSGANDEIRGSLPDVHPDEAARRHRRMSAGADELTPVVQEESASGSGATSIDMGAGGEGTDIE